jgi:type IV pilus assembly protein PilC
MPTYTYVARTRDGKKQTGTLTAENRQALTQALQRRGLSPDRVQEMGGTASGVSRVKVKSTELLVFTRQLSTIIDSGLPLLQGLDILGEQTEDVRFQKAILDIAQNVEAGETFSESLRRYPRIFSELYVSMVRAGEASGDLDGVLLQLADYLESMEELKRRVKSAMMYPVMAFSMIILITVGLLLFVVPRFEEIFKSFGDQALPAPTQVLIFISNQMISVGAFIFYAALVGLVIAIRAYRNTETGKYQTDAFLLRMPVVGKLMRKVAISRFTRTLSTLTRSGVAILGALEIAERTSGNEVFAKVIRDANDSVRNGETLAEPLARSEQFPAMVTRMIGVGEKTGALEQMLQKVSEFYDSEVKTSVDGLTSLIEPLLIFFMGIIVGGIVIALFMPILNLSSLVG